MIEPGWVPGGPRFVRYSLQTGLLYYTDPDGFFLARYLTWPLPTNREHNDGLHRGQ